MSPHRFAGCLRAGMEVSLASRDEDPGLAHAPALGLFRRLSRHAHTHARTLHGAPYLAGCWRLPCGAAAAPAPRLREDSRRSPTGGEAHQLPSAVRIAAAPPHTAACAPPPFLLESCSPPLAQDPAAPRHTSSSSTLQLHAALGLSHELVGADAPRAPSPTPSFDPAPRHRRLPGHTAPPPSSTLSPMLGHHAPFTRPPAVLAPQDLAPPPTRVPRWPGAAPTWTPPERTNTRRPDAPLGGRGGGPRPAPPPGAALPRDSLTPEDRAELRQLEVSYTDKEDTLPTLQDERMPRLEEVGRLYTAFIERRAKFLQRTPRYGTVAAADRARLLHVAVAMSTYYMGALHIDISDFTYRWTQRDGGGSGGGPSQSIGDSASMMSVSAARQLLTHQQFVHVMKFYTTYREVLDDQTVSILMQVMSLFYPEAGLEAPSPVEEARHHYLGLLSRYLATTHGPREGARRLATLLTSQKEARQLVDVLRTVDLTPREPRLVLGTSRAMLTDRIQLVCAAARRGRRARDAGITTPVRPAQGPVTPPSHTQGVHSPPAPVPHTHSPLTPPAQPPRAAVGLEEVGRLLSRLASCEDPATLAEARRILPVPLLRRFLHLLHDAAPPRRASHTTPPPQCTPPSPSPSPPSPHLHRGVTHTAGEPPPPPPPAPHHLHALPAAAHPPELAAE